MQKNATAVASVCKRFRSFRKDRLFCSLFDITPPIVLRLRIHFPLVLTFLNSNAVSLQCQLHCRQSSNVGSCRGKVRRHTTGALL